MRGNNRKSIEKCRKRLPQFTTMNVIDGQAGLVIYSSLIFYSLTIDNILNIIVLLILAGVSIATLTGDNGILKQANKAKEETEIAAEKEKIKLAFGAVLQGKIANNDSTNIGSKEFEEELKKLEPNVEVTEEEDNLKIKYLESKREYKITQKGEFLEETEKPAEDIKIKVKEETVKIMKKAEGNIEAKTMITGYVVNVNNYVESPEAWIDFMEHHI